MIRFSALSRVVRGAVAAVFFASISFAASAGTTIHVNCKSSGAVEPYGTPETAATTLTTAIAYAKTLGGEAFPVTVSVAPGTYREHGLVLDCGISVVGSTGDPADVIVDDTQTAAENGRAFDLTSEDARVSGLTVTSEGSGSYAEGGHVRMSAGTVENCVIEGGKRATSRYTLYGANVYMTGGRLARCKVRNGNMAPTGAVTMYGGGVYAAGDAVVESCLISGNVSAAIGMIYGIGVCLDGSAKLVNSTVVDNRPPAGTGGTVKAAGVYVKSATAAVVNTILFGNGGTVACEYGTDNRAAFTNCYSSVENADGTGCGTMAADDFACYAAGNFALAVTSDLVDGGNGEILPPSASGFDLAGRSRVSGAAIDVGAYELQQGGLTVGGKLSSYGLAEGRTVLCTARALGGVATGYRWDFGNGEPVVETQSAEIEYAFPASGLFSVKVAATTDGVAWSGWTELLTRVAVVPATMYVDPRNGSAARPYATSNTAARTIAAVLETMTNNVSAGRPCVDGVSVRLLPGAYSELDTVLDAGVTITGDTGDPKDVVFTSATKAKGAFTLTHADAHLESVTISGAGRQDNLNAGHIRMSAGTVENCVLGGGRLGSSKNTVYGANVYMTGGRLVRCAVTGGGTVASTTRPLYGSGVYATGDAVVESCLVTGNGSGTAMFGAVCLEGAARLVNSTVVGNTPPGGSVQNTAGVYVNSADAAVVNTIIFGNGGTEANEFGSQNPSCYSSCRSSVAIGGTACGTMAVEDFANYDAGDYSLAGTSSLIDAGSNELLPDGMSAFDLAGEARISGSHEVIDIGAYEFQQGGLIAGGWLKKYGLVVGQRVLCAASLVGVSATGYRWDFGNGEPVVETQSAEIEYAFPTSGLFTVKVAATADGVTWSDWTELLTKAVVVPERMYVDPSCANPQFPYATPDTAARTIAAVFATMTNNVSAGRPCVDGVTVRLLPGAYADEDTVLDAGLTIRGETGDPKDVIFNNATMGRCAFTLAHADARLESVTICGAGRQDNVPGGHVSISAGTVADCVIGGGRLNSSAYDLKGANVHMGGGRLVRCTVFDGRTAAGASSGLYGSGVYATGDAVVENCLVTGNGSGTVMFGTVCLEGGAKLVNSTVVGNTPPGGSVQNTAGVYVNSANARVVNTVMFDNGGTAENEFGKQNLGCYGYCASSVANEECATWRVIADAAFKDYAKAGEDVGNLRPSRGGPLHNGGCTREAYAGTGAISEVDILGGRRIVGPRLDIGCIEGVPPGTVMFVR